MSDKKMRYEDIKKLATVSMCFGFILIIDLLVDIVIIYRDNPRGYSDNWNLASLHIFGMVLIMFLFIIAPVLYLRHLNKIEKEKTIEIPIIQKKELPEVSYCQICGAEVLDKIGDFCSKCGTKRK